MASVSPILALPTLSPTHLVPRRARPFPLNRPELLTTYLGRNAVWRAVRQLGLEGAEVIVPAYHHGVEVAALVDAAAIPRFARLGPQLELDLNHVESLITPRTRALYVIHFIGYPQPLDALHALARGHDLLLIEDCALAMFSSEGTRPLGSVGDASIFCFYKTVPIPHGGGLLLSKGRLEDVSQLPPPLLSTVSLLTGSILLTGQRVHPRAGRLLRNAMRNMTHGARARAQNVLVPVGTQDFDLEALKLGMSRLSRWVLYASDAEDIVRRRRENFAFLHQEIGAPERTLWNELPPGMCPLFYPFRVNDKDRALATLRSHGIQAIDFWRWGHPSAHDARFPDVEQLRRQVIELPCHQDLEPQQLAHIAQVARLL